MSGTIRELETEKGESRFYWSTSGGTIERELGSLGWDFCKGCLIAKLQKRSRYKMVALRREWFAALWDASFVAKSGKMRFWVQNYLFCTVRLAKTQAGQRIL